MKHLLFENWTIFDVCACVPVSTEREAHDLIKYLTFFGHTTLSNCPLRLTNGTYGTYLVGVEILGFQDLTRLQTTLNYLRSQLS